MQQSIDYILSLIDAEVAAGTPEERIVLGGFSQGLLPPRPSSSVSLFGGSLIR